MTFRPNGIFVLASDRNASRSIGRLLVSWGCRQVRAISDLVSLRRRLLTGDTPRRLLLVVRLDRDGLDAFELQLTTMLADRGGFPATVFCVGMVSDPSLQVRAAQVGCDVCVTSPSMMQSAVDSWTTGTIVHGTGRTIGIRDPLLASLPFWSDELGGMLP